MEKVRIEMGNPIAPERRSSILGSSQDHAVPMGVTVKTKIERGDRQPSPEMYNLEITLLESLRGQDAWGRIKAEGVCDLPPAAGFEYILARIRFGYFRRARGVAEHSPYKISDGTFAARSKDGITEYELPPILRQPQPQLMGVPFTGGDSREGWIVLQVPEAEKEPLLVFHRQYAVDNKYGMWGAIWFKLFKFDPMCLDSSCADCR
jgi:hypothetical protein